MPVVKPRRPRTNNRTKKVEAGPVPPPDFALHGDAVRGTPASRTTDPTRRVCVAAWRKSENIHNRNRRQPCPTLPKLLPPYRDDDDDGNRRRRVPSLRWGAVERGEGCHGRLRRRRFPTGCDGLSRAPLPVRAVCRPPPLPAIVVAAAGRAAVVQVSSVFFTGSTPSLPLA